MAITPNDRETIAAVDSISGDSFYVEGTSATGAINVNIAGSAVTFDGNITEIGGAAISLGQKTMANSFPVAIASDQSAVPVSQNGTWNITNISGTVSLPTGAATAANQTNASQKTQIVDGSGNVIASTSNALNVSAALVTNPLVSAPLVGQTIMAVTGTAVRLNGGTSQPLTNGIIISAPAGNVGPISVGISSVNNTQDGTGNGYLLAAGASISFAVNNTNAIYINGLAGDYISWAGS